MDVTHDPITDTYTLTGVTNTDLTYLTTGTIIARCHWQKLVEDASSVFNATDAKIVAAYEQLRITLSDALGPCPTTDERSQIH